MSSFVVVLVCCIALIGPNGILADEIEAAPAIPHVHKAPKAAYNPDAPSPWKNVDWEALADKELARAIDVSNNVNRGMARNVIMFMGDGMGVTTTSAARLYNYELNKLSQEDIYLAWEKFPHVGISRTYSADRSTPDSASTGTAYLCGVKANYFTLGVTDKVQLRDCESSKVNRVRSILKESVAKGKWTGVVTTTRITHASPAAAYAHTPDRDWEASVPTGVTCDDIATQLVTDPENKQIRVLLGGGRQMFMPTNESDPAFPTTFGLRTDGRNLIEVWKDNKTIEGERFAYVTNKTEFDSVDPLKTDYLFGLFNPSHMYYELDRISETPVREPSLADMTEKAIRILQREPNGFFLFVEGGMIDQAHHANKAVKALNDTLALSQAVQRAVNLTSERDTLIVVTADHSHVFSYGGYASFGASILGLTDSTETIPLDKKPYMQMGYANGPGYLYHKTLNGSNVPRKNLTGINCKDPNFQTDSGVAMASDTHGGEDVQIFALGPMSHLFHGVHEQNYIPRVMMYASCVGRPAANASHCDSATTSLAGYWTTDAARSSGQRQATSWWP